MTPIKSRNEAFHILLGPDRGTTKSQREVTYHEPERVPLRINSDLAPWATAHVLIRSNPYAAISQPDGSFSIPNLPPGDWEFATWHERKGWLQHWPQGKFMKTIKPGENNLGEIKLKPELFQPQD